MKELLTRADLYNTINNVDDEMHTYVPCKKWCDACTNFVVPKSSFNMFCYKKSLKIYSVYLICFQKCNLYCIFFKLFKTRSQIYCWFRNCKSHTNKKVRSCSIVYHDLLLQKQRFWISTLVTIYKGLNSTHDWNRNRRT